MFKKLFKSKQLNLECRLVIRGTKDCRITPVLKSLHWLPVTYRIQYKVILLTFKALIGQAPQYIKDMIQPRQNTKYATRSNTSRATILDCPKSKHPTLGDRAFAVAAPSTWNKLPAHIRNIDGVTLDQFKTKLKTHLFKLAFE